MQRSWNVWSSERVAEPVPSSQAEEQYVHEDRYYQVEKIDRNERPRAVVSRPLRVILTTTGLLLAILLIGDDDRIVPVESSVRLTEQLLDAELVVCPDCGLVPQEECPAQFLEDVLDTNALVSEN